MKKLLMLGGGYLQTFVIKKAKQLGYYVLVLDANPQAEGFLFADEYAAINIIDEEACLAYAIEHKIDGVLTAATDFSVLTMSRIAQTLKLPGLNYKSAKIIKNKSAVRKCLYESHADDTGYSYEITSDQDIMKISKKAKFPLMVKPCDGSGSRGASKVCNIEEFKLACDFAISNSIKGKAVAEPFINGKEYGVESFVSQGNVIVLAIMQKKMTNPPYYAELGHAIPSGLSFDMEEKVKLCVKKAIKALGINHGSVNMDLLISVEGNVHIVDVGARMGGNLIGSHIIPISTGIDYMGNMIKAAVNDAIDWNKIQEPKAVATSLLALSPGVVMELPNMDIIAYENDVVIETHLSVGDKINEYHTNLDGCGYVVVESDDVNKAMMKAELVKERIDKAIKRG